jgi:hypothetical protein
MEPSLPQLNDSPLDSKELCWIQVNESELRQGDYLPNCLVPIISVTTDEILGKEEDPVLDIQMKERDLIIITQSCDLGNRKVRLVALCSVYTIAEFEESSPSFTKKGKWNDVLSGKIVGLHLLPSLTEPDNNRDSLVVDFREIHSLPFEVVLHQARKTGDRWRLQSPYLERFSQSFAQVFMRVALPSSIPPFK